ncbi:homeobox protein B-H2-like isoform X1 [Toxorhynchites rutilus septentrionalis]|uniref:homeobox protein B-H2-like isoform X1 n=1 Tax=Toxorhynchites rutilus septentrionalis TaxID=329112 RepID=UPI0024784D20|nr:homeobox protein B-H2-like isoform X1 [Toxorhynchites rutilus septentrionalis]
MLCRSPPPASPAVSEISVGSPSPPPVDHHHHLHHHHHHHLQSHHSRSEDYFTPLKRLRMVEPHSTSPKELSSPSREPPSPPSSIAAPSVASLPKPATVEGVKSFSIADILGRDTESSNRDSALALQHHHSTLQAAAAKIVRPWDHLRGPIPVRPFLPPALLHYEHRLALDYHQQLQEHFRAQAQLLRHMSMDIIPSESGSERSSSAASGDCCSPEIGRSSDHQSSQSSSSGSNNNNNNNGGGSGGKGGASGGGSGKSSGVKTTPNGTPLDALFQMTNKNFDEANDDGEQSHLNLFANRPQPKKKRKSRTAFTNHQIFELERRFLYQKYLSPSDRDEIAAALGLSNAQVITWFQNRRAKMKRDWEETKKDIESVKVIFSNKTFLENVNDMNLLKKKIVHGDGESPQK